MANADTRRAGPLGRARDAAERLAWEDAFEAFSQADVVSRLDAEDLEQWAAAAYLLSRVDSAVDILSRAHRLHLDVDDNESALLAGHWIVFMLMEKGEPAKASGWISICGQLLERLPADSVANAYMLALRAYEQVAVQSNYTEGRITAEKAIEIGRRAADHDIEALALTLKGRALIREGRIDDGMVALDEAMLAVVSGVLSPIVVGTVYCSLIEACEEVSELRRAQEWTEALNTWCDQQKGELPFTAQCLIHRSKIHHRHGELKEAEDEARWAYERYTRTPYERGTGKALYQLAEIQRIRGDLDQAEDTYREASDWGIDPQPGLALLRLAQGDTDTAVASMRRLVAETMGVVDRMRFLPAYVEVMLAAEDLKTAAEASSELSEYASLYATDALKAEAAYAEGAVSLARGDVADALIKLRKASEAWLSLNAPYQTARVRMLIGRACRQLGDEETAVLELNAASRQFVDLGVPDMTRHTVGDPETDHNLTAREIEVLRLLATGATNQAIADDLYLAVKTVDRHVSSILTKLGVASRTAAVSYAYENHLV